MIMLKTPANENQVATHFAAGLTVAQFHEPRNTTNRKMIMKTKLIPAIAVMALTLALTSTAFAKTKEVTLTGGGQCAKCVLHETKKCQNTLIIEEHGKPVTYYLVQNKVSKAFHDQICQAPARITVTSKVKKVHGKLELTPTRIELAK
jgi:uncharacterized membrane protein YcjF (UPF0283 family)